MGEAGEEVRKGGRYLRHLLIPLSRFFSFDWALCRIDFFVRLSNEESKESIASGCSDIFLRFRFFNDVPQIDRRAVWLH